MTDKFVISPKAAPRTAFYLRLRPDTLEKLNQLEKKTTVRRAEIIQQALDYALERLELC